MAGYYHLLLEQFRDGDFSFLSTVSTGGQFTLFDLETYVGRDGVAQGFTAWRQMFSSPIFELIEFVNPPGGAVFVSVRTGGAGAASGVNVEDVSYVVIRVEGGMAVRGAAYRDRSDALSDIGLLDYAISARDALVGKGQ